MKRLTQDNRLQLRRQLMAVMLPSKADELSVLADAAFHAALRSFYTAAGLRRIAKLPPEWLSRVTRVHVKATGNPYWAAAYGKAEVLLPKAVPDEHTLSAEAQAAVDTWQAAVEADKLARATLEYRLDRLLASASTLEALLQRLPEARDILNLPPDEAPDAIAEDVRAQLAAKGGAA